MAESSFTVHEPLTIESSKKVYLNISGTDTDIGTVYKYTNGMKRLCLAASTVPATGQTVSLGNDYRSTEGYAYCAGMDSTNNTVRFVNVGSTTAGNMSIYAGSHAGIYCNSWYK